MGKYASVLFCVFLHLSPIRVSACAAHLFMNADQLGFFGGTVARLAGMEPPQRIFGLEYKAMATAVVGEPGEIVVAYSRPYFSKNVRLELTTTGNVEVLHNDFALNERNGAVSIPYQVMGDGYNTISLRVFGEHKGKLVQETGQIYIRAMSETPVQGPEFKEG